MNIVLILSGGTGTRLGMEIPKQYIEVAGRPIISYCIETLSLHNGIDAIWVVADKGWQERLTDWLGEYDTNKKFKGFSEPGATRQLSILNGLNDICGFAKESDAVFIHDAARPLLSKQLISDCLDALKGHDGVLPVLPMKDTVYCSKDGKKVSSLLNRSEIYSGQAPEIFRLGRYHSANVCLLPKEILKINGSTEPAIMAGMDIAMIPGDENNFKITTKADMERFQKIIEKSSEEDRNV